MLSVVCAPGYITNKINASLKINHRVNRYRWLTFYATTCAEKCNHQFVVATTGAFTLTSVNGLLRLINSMVTELIRPVTYNPGRSQKLIKLEISSCRCSRLECNKESDETEGYSALYTPLLPLNTIKQNKKR